MQGVIAVAAHAAAGLVLVAGLTKLWRPGVTREALGLDRRPHASLLVRGLGAGELALAAAVLVFGGPLLFGLLAATYLGFLAVAERQRRAGRGCGCLGTATATVGPLHLGVDAVAATVALAAAWTAVPGLPAILQSQHPVVAVTALGLAGLAVVLAQLLLTSLPELLAVRARVAGGAVS